MVDFLSSNIVVPSLVIVASPLNATTFATLANSVVDKNNKVSKIIFFI